MKSKKGLRSVQDRQENRGIELFVKMELYVESPKVVMLITERHTCRSILAMTYVDAY